MGNRSFLVFLLLTIGLIFAICDISSLYAQETETEEFTLEEITVTAQKREENMQKVPIAMEVISGEDLIELGSNNIDEILTNSVANAIILKSQDGYRVSIRGMSDYSEPFRGQSQAAPSVAINMDGVYSNRKDTASGLYDIERVEVLFGPQSTLYSSNSPAGIVNVITAQPKTDRYEVSGSLEYGNYGLLHTEGAMNAPISDKTAIRASFATSIRDAYIDNGSDNEDTKAARIRALLQANDKLSITATGEMTKNIGRGFGGGVEPFIDQDDVDNPWTGTQMDSLKSNDQNSKKVYGQMDWDTGIGGLSLTASYSTRSGNSQAYGMGGGGPGGPPPGGGGTESTEETEFRFQSGSEKGIEARMASSPDFFFEWIAGGTYYVGEDSNKWSSSTESTPPNEALMTPDSDFRWGKRVMTNKTRALFANITYPILDRFRLTAGYRQSWDEWISDNEEVKGSLDPQMQGALEYEDMSSSMSTEGSPDYKFGFEYNLGENSMLFGDYSTSYRVQGMGGGGGGPPPGGGGGPPPGGGGGPPPGEGGENPPEKLKSYTVGSKNRLFENKLQLNLSAYYYDYRNTRASSTDRIIWVYDTDGDKVRDDLESERDSANTTGDGHVIGMDIQTSWVVTPKDNLNFSFSWIHSAWDDLYLEYDYSWTYELIDDEVVYVPLYDEDYEGKPMMNTPKWTANLNYTHNFNLPNGGILRAGLTSRIQAGYRLSWDESTLPLSYQETHHIDNINIAYNNPDGKWSLSAYVNNVFNYAEKRMYMRIAGGGAEQGLMSIGDPRTYGAVLSVKF